MKRPTGLQARASISCSACSRGRVIPQKRPFLESSCAQRRTDGFIFFCRARRGSVLFKHLCSHLRIMYLSRIQDINRCLQRASPEFFLYLIRICDSNFHKKICTSDSQVFPAHKSFFSFKSSGYDDTLVSFAK